MIKLVATNFPYMLVPMIVYVICGYYGPIEADILQMPTVSGDVIIFRAADLALAMAFICLTIEGWKASRVGTAANADTIFSFIVAIAALLLFLMVPHFGSRTFFMLMLASFADVLVGAVVSNNTARRDWGAGTPFGGG